MMDEPRTLAGIMRQCNEDSRLWFPKLYAFSETETLAHHALAMAGEAGEVANKVKKVWRRLGRASFQEYEHEVRADLLEENMDVFIYNMNIFELLGAGDVVALYRAKRAINLERFGGGSV